MLRSGLGENIFNHSSFATGEGNAPVLKSSDFETTIQIPDHASSVAGIFVLPVARQTGTGGGRCIEVNILGAVAVNAPMLAQLHAAGWSNQQRPTLMQAKAEADARNEETRTRSQTESGITAWQRSEIDVRSLVAAKPIRTAQPQ